MADYLPALRVVHLLGGLRASDYGEPEVTVGVDGGPAVLKFARPPYQDLYRELQSHGFQPVGIEFFTDEGELTGQFPIRWETWGVKPGFHLKDVREAWSNIKAQASHVKDQAVVTDISARIRTYLVLLNIRLRHLSAAYHSTLKAYITTDQPVKTGLFANMFMDEIEAAIHAFLADAASFRDLLAEACWRLVLKRSDQSVAQYAKFLKRAKGATHPLAVKMTEAGEPGGNIKNLTDLRNGVIHVAPLGRSQEHCFCDLREKLLPGGTRVQVLHFPMTDSNWGLRSPASRTIDYADEEDIRRSLESYRSFVQLSGDALEYAWRTINDLASLSHEIRQAAGLQAPIPRITPIGPVRITRGDQGGQPS
jgi:hypothetical protein